MKFENTEVFNFEGALRGMRLPLQSGAKADSHYCIPNECVNCKYSGSSESKCNPYSWDSCFGESISWTPYYIGDNDIDLAQRLIKAGTEHGKYTRMIGVSVDITAPMYLWSQIDTYKIGTVASSTSKMHTLAKFPITKDCFEMIDYDETLKVYDREPYNENFTTDDIWEEIINHCETLRQRYNETKDKRYWKELIRLLPESYMQTRTWTANYAVLRNMYKQRCATPHKLTEWKVFGEWVQSLPYAAELITYGLNNKEEK